MVHSDKVRDGWRALRNVQGHAQPRDGATGREGRRSHRLIDPIAPPLNSPRARACTAFVADRERESAAEMGALLAARGVRIAQANLLALISMEIRTPFDL